MDVCRQPDMGRRRQPDPRDHRRARSSCIGRLLTRLGKRWTARSPRPHSHARNSRCRLGLVASRPHWRIRRGSVCRLDRAALESVGELASAGKLLGSCHGCVAGFASGSGFAEAPQAVGPGQVVCHGDVAVRHTVFAGGWAVVFIGWDPIFVASPMWGLAHAVWHFAPVCGDADRWLKAPLQDQG